MAQPEISELIDHVKKELTIISDDTDIFFVEEINLEIHFTVTGDVGGGFNLGVVTVDSNVNEQRIQKISLKLVPILSKEEILGKLPKEKQDELSDMSSRVLFKGSREKG